MMSGGGIIVGSVTLPKSAADGVELAGGAADAGDVIDGAGALGACAEDDGVISEARERGCVLLARGDANCDTARCNKDGDGGGRGADVG